MTEAKYLKDMLCLMVDRHGPEQVDRALREIVSAHRRKSSNKAKAPSKNSAKAKPEKKKTTAPKKKTTAPEYVAKMELPSEKKRGLAELAKRFEEKNFLPSFGDIREFCLIYRIVEPASKSRVSALPRIFKFIATLESSDIQKILDSGLFSGPARLGPIADAIMRNGRSAAATYIPANPPPSGNSPPATSG